MRECNYWCFSGKICWNLKRIWNILYSCIKRQKPSIIYSEILDCLYDVGELQKECQQLGKKLTRQTHQNNIYILKASLLWENKTFKVNLYGNADVVFSFSQEIQIFQKTLSCEYWIPNSAFQDRHANCISVYLVYQLHYSEETTADILWYILNISAVVSSLYWSWYTKYTDIPCISVLECTIRYSVFTKRHFLK